MRSEVPCTAFFDSMTDEQLADMKRFIELTEYSFSEGVYDYAKSDWVIVHSSDEARDI